MTVRIGEGDTGGVFDPSIEVEIYHHMSRCLGEQATTAFFNLYRSDTNIVHRTRCLARAAKLLELFGEDDTIAVTAATEFIPDNITPITARHDEIAMRPEMPLEQDEFRLSDRITGLLYEICDSDVVDALALGADDRDAVVSALIEMRGEFGSRVKVPTLREYIGLIYDGYTDVEANAKLGLSTTPAALSQKWSGHKRACVANFESGRSNPDAILTAHVRPETSDALVVTMPGTQVAEEVTEIVQHAELTDEDRFYEALNKITRGDQAVARAIDQLIYAADYDTESMAVGTAVLGELVGRYAADISQARATTRSVGMSKAEYGVLCRWAKAGAGAGNPALAPQTLPSVLRYEVKPVSRDKIQDYLTQIFEAAACDEYALTDELYGKAAAMIADAKNDATQEHEPTCDLFAVAAGDVEVTRDTWEREVQLYLRRLSDTKVLPVVSRCELEGRLLGSDEATSISEGLKDTLDILRHEASCCERLQDNEAIHTALQEFTRYQDKVRSMESIRTSVSKVIGRNVSMLTIRKMLAGGIYAAMESRAERNSSGTAAIALPTKLYDESDTGELE